MWNLIKPRAATLRFWQLGLLVLVFVFWHVMTAPGLIPPMMFDNERQAAFFFGEPVQVVVAAEAGAVAVATKGHQSAVRRRAGGSVGQHGRALKRVSRPAHTATAATAALAGIPRRRFADVDRGSRGSRRRRC